MYRKVLNYLRGQVTVEVESAAPERVLNLCAAHNIPFWELEWLSEIRLRAVTSRAALPRLQAALAQTDAAVTVLRRQGAPEVWRQYRRRYVLWAAAGLLLAASVLGSTHIWDFQVTGNDTVPTETILRTLEKYGVTLGSRSRIDQEDLRNHALMDLPDVVWLTVNIRGCTAHVQVVERQRPPEIADEAGVWNIVAARDGLVTRVRALDGKALVAEGSTVTEGELLVTGVYESREGNTYMTHSLGTVEARTWYELSVSVPLEITEKSGGRREKTALSVDFGKKRIKLWGRGSISGASCDKITYYHPLSLPGGLRLPITMVRESVTYYDGQSVRRSREQAQKEGETLLLQQLKAQLGRDGSVTETRFSAAEEGDYLTVTLQAECLEQIGVPVQVQQTEEAN